MIRLLGFLLCGCLLLTMPARAAEQAVPRTVLALFDSKVETRLRFSNALRFAALPLNHLGYRVEYADVRQPLPELAGRQDLRGIVIWLSSAGVPDAARLWRWMDGAIDAGLKVVILGDLPLRSDVGASITLERANATLRRIGFEDGGYWDAVTIGSRLQVHTPEMVNFERQYDDPPPSHSLYRITDPALRPHLTAVRPDGRKSDLVLTGPKGGFVASGFIFFRDPTYLRTQWHLNPFAFLRQVFGADAAPIPDTTTLNGRRIYYSHVDGDGWLNISQVPGYAKRRAVAAEVILHEIAIAYPDLPVTISPVVAELDPDWHGSAAAMEIARQFFVLPNVEPSSHTYSHPFQWSFFESYSPAREAPFRSIYNARGQQRYQLGDEKTRGREAELARAVGLGPGYRIPRAYGDRPFDPEREISGALQFLTRLAPAEKPPRLVQWSGDTSPSKSILALTRMAGALNLNGGDSRFDSEYPSYSSVAPLGLWQQGELQVFSSNSNENTYTELWTNRFFGQRYVQETWTNTDRNRRVAPINLYYHIYAGERLASLKALHENLAWVRQQEIAPITAYTYADIVRGYHSAEIVPVGPQRWRVLSRGALQTLRLDGTLAELTPHYAQSRGVIGHRRIHKSLYIALDPAVAEPELALAASVEAPAQPHVEASRWQLRNLECTDSNCRAQAEGFGPGQLVMRGLTPGRWRIRLLPQSGSAILQMTDVGSDGSLTADFPPVATMGVRIDLERLAP